MFTKRVTLAFVLGFTLLLITACGSKTADAPAPAQSATQNQLNSPTITSTQAPVPAAPYSLAQLYQARVSSGEWTAGEGLVQLLGMYTGSSQANQVLAGAVVSDNELTGLMDLADRFLVENPSGALHDEVQKQVNQLVAPLDLLPLYSQKGTLVRGSSPHLASVTQPSHQAIPSADTVRCSRLWEDGFSSTTPLLCFEYAVSTVAGTEIRMYYPNWWAA